MQLAIDKKRYYQLKEMRTGTPVHVAQRFLRKYCENGLPVTNRAAIIYIVMNHVFLADDKYDTWVKIFEISLNLLFAADKKDANKFEQIFDITTVELLHFESCLHINYEKVKNLIDENISDREKYMRLMDFYKNLYEGYYKCVSSIFAISKKMLNNKQIPGDIKEYIHEDPAIKIEELKKDDSNERVLPIPELCEGCNNHLRNSICHEHWSIKGNILEMWDRNTKRKKDTWRKQYIFDTLKDEVDILQATVEAMMLAIMLHSISKHKNINGILSIAPGPYEFDFIEDAMQNTAFNFGLHLNDCEIEKNSNALKIVLCIPENLDLEQVSQIIEGGKRPRFYKIPMCVVENSVRDMVLNFLLIVAGPMLSYPKVTIIVVDEKAGKIGDFDITKAELDNFIKGDRGNLEKVFDVLKPYKVKITREGPSVPDYPWAPIKDDVLLANWKKMNLAHIN